MNSQITLEGFALSPQQKLNWKETPSYNLCLARVPESWKKEEIGTAVIQLINKHEILRTRFDKVSGMEFPLQVIEATSSQDIYIDQTNIIFNNEKEIVSYIKDQANKFEGQKTSLEENTTGNFQLFKLKGGTLYLALRFSATISDAHALTYILDDLSSIYLKKESEEPLQYADLSDWLNQIAAEQNEYWKKPEDFVLKNTINKQCTIENLLSIVLQEKLNILTTAEVEAILATSWHYLTNLYYQNATMFYYSNGRTLPELKGAFGAVERAFPITVLSEKFSGENTIKECQKEFIKIVAEGKEWEHDIPYKIEKAKENYPSFRLVENTSTSNLSIVWQSVLEKNQSLALTVYKSKTEYRLQISTAFSEVQTSNIMAQYSHILEQVLSFPNLKFDQIAVVGKQQQNQLVNLGTGKSISYSNTETLHNLIAQQVQKTPNAIAISYEGETITYATLNEKANTIARCLINNNDNLIGVYSHRSIEMIVTLLGILKAGKAYIPIEPSYPLGRINAIVKKSNLNLILSQTELELPELAQKVSVIKISDLKPIDSEIRGSNKTTSKTAYVLFTSGSTGTPKGVVVGHSQVVNHMLWMQKEYPLNTTDKVLQRTPFGFDASVWEIFAPLLQGAQLVLLPTKAQQNVHAILNVIKEEEITVFQTVPSLLNLLLQEATTNTFKSIRSIFCGGEVLQPHLVDKVLNTYKIDLINLYGPTECTIQVCHHKCSKNENSIPIGKPIDGVSLYVLNKDLQFRPVGVIGELFISGNCVSQGYLNEEALTNESFIQDVIDSSKTMYKTGDLAFWNENGTLEIVGRTDDQIKLRGFRIELGEIENVLRKKSEVSEIVVQLIGTGANQNIACFYTTNSDKKIKEELQLLAKNSLPEYMVPTYFILMENLPLTHNGKVDKNYLKTYDVNTILENKTIIAPKNSIEVKLLSIWKELLKQEEICVTDNFFNIGGHSLLAVNLATAIQKSFNQKFPLSTVFDAPSIVEQSCFLSEESKNVHPNIITLNKGNQLLAPLFLCPPTGGLSGTYFKLAQLLGDRPVYGLQDPLLNEENQVNYQNIEDLGTIYATAISTFTTKKEIILGGWSFGGIVALETAKKAKELGYKIAELVMFDSFAPTAISAMPSDQQLNLSVGRLLANFNGAVLSNQEVEKLSDKAYTQSLQLLLELAIKAQLLPKEAKTKDISTLITVFKKNVSVLSAYLSTPHSFKIHLFEPEKAVPSYLKEAAFENREETASSSWTPYGEVVTYPTGGHHLNMLSDDYVEELSHQLIEILKK